MRKTLIHIIYLSCFIVLGQSTKDDYEIYSKTIDFGVKSFDSDFEFSNSGNSQLKPFKIAVIIEKLEFDFRQDHLLFTKKKNTEYNNINKFLKWMFRDSVKVERDKIHKDLIEVLPNLDSTFTNHTRINSDFLNLETLEVRSLSAELFEELIDNSTNYPNRRWRKIKRKFKNSLAFGLSKIKYIGNFASVYYWVDCGKFVLCKSEHVIIFEKINGEWQILNDIYLWISP